MGESNPDPIAATQVAGKPSAGMPAGVLATLVVTLLTLLGLAARYYVSGDLHVIHSMLSLFFSTNLLICYWEVCLFLRRDYIEQRTVYWRRWHGTTGRTPAREFLATQVPFKQLWSPTVWADVWATYSLFDDSYADRRTFGFNVDIANGFVTPIPTLILYAAYTVEFLPAVLAGILGLMLFWQWVYVSSVYWVSFFVAKRERRITRGEMYLYVVATNAIWVLSGLLGLYVSVRVTLDGNYSVLGY